MIKRRFYKVDHGGRDASDASSSSSDSEIEAEATDESESEDDEMLEPEVKQDNNDDDAGSASSGYKCEDSFGNDVDANSSGLFLSDDDDGTLNERPKLKNKELSSKRDHEVLEKKSKVLVDENKSVPVDALSYILKCKSVFKCRICPRIICLNEAMLRDHVQSKRHAHSEKLLNQGRLKAILNSDGEIENLDVSDVEANDSEDDEDKDHYKRQKQNKKKFKKKRDLNVNSRKIQSPKGSAKKKGKK
ncbi:hypothetical protein HN51_005190 [Arachis hypogaea]|uniref:Uncharacterized protein n=2 Tax=Arachis TaxID=3817 RepID=A0A445DFN8_ARAHY|nr:uncharacterized protein LOC107484259 isoform X1 [Arachis duranensis]XP_025695501.1 uncharacterized protein LOC112797002 isoform X1 [Arachis hypogaea]XP_025695503.1 uncharacterized protein LOC112797002 isoform X1 [Arachis hypogaea]XP_057753563.1 uncharacterized protein LOC130973157 [Arachis stenosperma]XP_057753564.1 uncharacterized protein LOC130973157 [Arachis stenosperma]QHO38908.1 uncharacterized protein DS421_4g124480 [Arachis hypogaea]RYR62007.1 hypothetical protein Ahy_A04g019302 [Ar